MSNGHPLGDLSLAEIIQIANEKYKQENKNRIVIETPWGPTTECARRQAALNMAADPAVRRRVEEFLQSKYGDEQGLAECRRRYPEAYENV